MVRRRRTSGLEDSITLASKLPWWLCLLLVAAAWFALQAIAKSEIAPPTTQLPLTSIFIPQLIRTGAQVGQYLLPIIFIAGALTSFFTRRQRRRLFDEVAINGAEDSIKRIGWQQFEQLIGEGFRRQGFSVIENEGKGADGGVNVVRELYGVMAAEGATGGFVVTSGRFTDEARSFAVGLNIELIDGFELQRWTKSAKSPAKDTSSNTSMGPRLSQPVWKESSESCPRCQSPMVRRTAKRGPNTGGTFWGCSRFPECRGVR